MYGCIKKPDQPDSNITHLQADWTQKAVKLRCLVTLKERKEDMDTKGNHFKVCKNEFYSAIIDEDLGRLTDLLKKYWSNFVSEIQGGPSGESPWKGVATLPLHLAVSYRRLKSVQSLLSAGMDTEMRSGQTRRYITFTYIRGHIHADITPYPELFCDVCCTRVKRTTEPLLAFWVVCWPSTGGLLLSVNSWLLILLLVK